MCGRVCCSGKYCHHVSASMFVRYTDIWSELQHLAWLHRRRCSLQLRFTLHRLPSTPLTRCPRRPSPTPSGFGLYSCFVWFRLVLFLPGRSEAEIGDLIASAMERVGNEGVITVQVGLTVTLTRWPLYVCRRSLQRRQRGMKEREKRTSGC